MIWLALEIPLIVMRNIKQTLYIELTMILTWKLYLGMAHDCILSFFMTFLSTVNEEPYVHVRTMESHDMGHIIRTYHLEA